MYTLAVSLMWAKRSLTSFAIVLLAHLNLPVHGNSWHSVHGNPVKTRNAFRPSCFFWLGDLSYLVHPMVGLLSELYGCSTLWGKGLLIGWDEIKILSLIQPAQQIKKYSMTCCHGISSLGQTLHVCTLTLAITSQLDMSPMICTSYLTVYVVIGPRPGTTETGL